MPGDTGASRGSPLMTHYAHSGSKGDQRDWHGLAAHLRDTGDRAERFLQANGLGPLARTAGLLHDLGKYSPDFQQRLFGDSKSVNHSTAGALVAVERYGETLGKMLAFCIAGHHAGLANGIRGERTRALGQRLAEPLPPLDPVWHEEVPLPELSPPRIRPRDRNTAGMSASNLVRMVFSALVDADFLDTEEYYARREGRPVMRGDFPRLAALSERLAAHLGGVNDAATPTPLNALRARILDHVRQQCAFPPGLFTLTVPTGGGKTLASLAFALDHAARHGLDRVIHVIPYTSIIEQTAAVFRDALRGPGDTTVDFVLEHHSTFDEERSGDREARAKLRLAMENWNAPVVVTTAVQFFESLFANRPSRCRKLHNIANSVVVLDEAQTLPLRYLRPCVALLDDLARNWRTSIVLCTATQPALRTADGFAGGFESVRELAPEPERLYRHPALKRTCIRHEGVMGTADLVARLREACQALCIVNTRRNARDLYEALRDGAPGACHLSTLMCAAHRSAQLRTVRAALKEGHPVRLVATSLVEAGVDIDFPEVWREEAGLESIAQAAGRCNREGRLDVGEVHVFEMDAADGYTVPLEVAQLADATRTVLRTRGDDPLALDALHEYFREVYWTKGEEALDAKGILRMLGERVKTLDFPFESLAREFRLIESPMVPVIVPYGATETDRRAVRALVRDLERVERPGGIARLLQPYIVQLPPDARQALLAAGAAVAVQEARFERQFVVLTNEDLYSAEVGLSWEDPTFREAESQIV